MLTRAKSLEIVVGNPETLNRDPFWRKFIEYCVWNGALINEPQKKNKKNKQRKGMPKRIADKYEKLAFDKTMAALQMTMQQLRLPAKETKFDYTACSCCN